MSATSSKRASAIYPPLTLLSSHSSLSPSQSRHPDCHLDFHTHPSFLPRPGPATLEHRQSPPSRRRATRAHFCTTLPPGPVRPHDIPLPHSSSALLAAVNRLRQWAGTNMIRGQRFRGRCMKEPESARDEPVSRRRTPAIPRRRRHWAG